MADQIVTSEPPTTLRLRCEHLLVDASSPVVADGVVDVAGATIGWAGAASEAPPLPPGTTTDDVGGLVLPGLVNSHAHTPMTLLRGAGDGLPLDRWLNDVMWPREARMTDDDVRWGMALGAAEMLRAGVTTTCEMYLFEDAVVAGAKDAGIRLVMTSGVVPGIDGRSNRDDELVAAIENHHEPAGRITVGVAPHSAYLLGIDRVAELAELARRHDVLLHVHLNETADENAELDAQGEGRLIARLAERGVFDGRVLAAHAVWVDESDIGHLARHGVAVAHCPISNMKLGAGIAPLTELRAAGLTLGLGTDGPASNDDLDLWQEVKTAPLLARVATTDPLAVSARDALAMATTGGAAALGLSVGSLSTGFRADIIRVDLDDAAFVPHLEPDDLIAHLVWSGSGRHVTDVWVEGQRVVRDRTCLTLDETAARSEVQNRARRLAEETR